MLCPESAVQGHSCSLGLEQKPSTCISSSSLPSADALDRICTSRLTFSWGLLQSGDTMERFLHSEDKEVHGDHPYSSSQKHLV